MTISKTKRLGLIYATILVGILSVPAFNIVTRSKPPGILYGYVDKIPDEPVPLAAGFRNKTSQTWIERTFDTSFGFRVPLIKSFNEATFRLFREMPRLRLYSTPEHGLYSGMSLEYLSREVRQKKQMEEHYGQTASKLAAVQAQLHAQGKEFVVVIASSKPYVYPDGLSRRYLSAEPATLYSKAASMGAALQRAGVNVIDSGPMLRQFAHTTNVPTHPPSGVHWNTYEGCLIAEKLLMQVEQGHPEVAPFTCGLPQYDAPHLTDIDGLQLMNLWGGGGVVKEVPSPAVSVSDGSGWRPSIVVIGDSFSDQIIAPLQQARAFSNLTLSGYFHVRDVFADGGGNTQTHDVNSDLGQVRSQIYKDIQASDVVVLEMVDYNLGTDGYGFPEYMLAHSPTGPASVAPTNSVKLGAAATRQPSTLAFVEVGNRQNPLSLPTTLTLTANTTQLLALAATDKRWDIVTVLQQANVRDRLIGKKLEQYGYTVVVDSKQMLIAVPRAGNTSTIRTLANINWQHYNFPDPGKAVVIDKQPAVQSEGPADKGWFTDELTLDRPTLLRVSFEGAITANGPRAAHFSIHGVKPLFSLPSGVYQSSDEFFVILPPTAGHPVRFSFGLGGWSQGAGTLRIKALDLYPIGPVAKPAL